MEKTSLHILVCPLDWGLGHATRCIPIIREALRQGHKVSIAGEGRSQALLKKEFPELTHIDLKGFSPTYVKGDNLPLKLVLLSPQFALRIYNELKQIKKIVKEHAIDIVFSDNRYGARTKDCRCIVMSHQIMIKTPDAVRFSEKFLYSLSKKLLNKFDACWIPDYAEAPGLSGDLSHKYTTPNNTTYVGPLSRFTLDGESKKKEKTYAISAIISGQEPQRSILENILKKQLKELNVPAIIVGGKTESKNEECIEEGKLKIMNYASSEEIKDIICRSNIVICRSGYSSVMDLQALGSKALLIATPGQTEQIYLAEMLKENKIAYCQTQQKLNLKADIPEALSYKGFSPDNTSEMLSSAIKNINIKQ